MTWLQIAQSLGVPVMAMVAMALAVWQSLRWIGREVLQPLAKRHVLFVDEVSVNLLAQTRALQAQTEALQTIASDRKDDFVHRQETTGQLAVILHKLDAIALTINTVRDMVTRDIVPAASPEGVKA
jgi:hypothetical protein